MKQEFHVTGLGLKIDGRMIMPGSVLKMNSKPPCHWQRFGEYKTRPEKAKEEPVKQFEVATPANKDKPGEEALKAEYEERFGKKPHHKMKPETIKAELDKAGE